jgi:outer membrane protein OmpA-like peptidoglycan-associated protein
MRLKTLICLACVCASPYLLAQTVVPSTEQMIEQLKAPRTRRLRNLAVEAAPAPARPSLSLLIQFDFNSARVRPASEQALIDLAQALQSTELKSSAFAIEGHTDAKGSEAYNLKLSQQRAEAVRDFLQSKGIDGSRLFASGKGASELANVEQPFAAENRRVRIVNLD